MEADPPLRGKVPHTGVPVRSIDVQIGRGVAIRGILVIRPKHASGALQPGGDAGGTSEVPAEDDRSDAGAVERASHGVRLGAGDKRSVGGLGAGDALEPWRKGLPVWEDFDSVLEVAVQETRTVVVTEHAAGVNAGEEELEAITVISDTDAALNQHSEFAGLMKRC